LDFIWIAGAPGKSEKGCKVDVLLGRGNMTAATRG
jgi:hypothetical protein